MCVGWNGKRGREEVKRNQYLDSLVSKGETLLDPIIKAYAEGKGYAVLSATEYAPSNTPSFQDAMPPDKIDDITLGQSLAAILSPYLLHC